MLFRGDEGWNHQLLGCSPNFQWVPSEQEVAENFQAQVRPSIACPLGRWHFGTWSGLRAISLERNVGQKTPLGLARGLNELWNKGGLQYAPPIR
jgi:hypothetical protein